MNILDLVVGKPIKTTDERAEEIGPAQGVPIFGLDGLSSAAYGPEAALSLLLPLGLLGVRYIVPISAAIITLLVIVYFSYRQTIAAYPSGGGSYTVARFNLGAPAGLLAAAALLADYILTAAVGISAGVGALISAVPSLLPHTVSLCLGILLVITILNLRGVRDAGTVFAVPTYLFVGTLLITIGAGVLRVLLSGGHPTPVVAPAPPPVVTEAVSYWLLLKVFASGCTALTGVEAVSNGVKAFREPTVKNAQRTLTVIIFLLALLLAGISFLVRTYGIAATDPGQPGYQSVLSMLTAAVFGKGFFYYLTIGSILVVLSLSANTAFADFPRLCRAIAQNNYLPHVFGYRGRRLVYTYGIVVLALLCGGVLLLFGGITDRLIPLYAVGAFLAFTLSQAGMVVHWRKNRGPHWMKSALVNGLGATVTGITTGVVLVAKFVEGAWITLLFIPLTIVCFVLVRRHYHLVKVLTSCKDPVNVDSLNEHPIAVIAIDRWSTITCQGIQFAARLSPEVIAVHVEPNEHSELLEDDWEQYVEKPFHAAGKEPPQLHVLPSPYRFVIIPFVQFVLDLSKTHPDRSIVVVIPELVEDKWYEYFLHNQRGRMLEWVLLARGNERIFTVSAPWYVGRGK
ncbi:MAG TPA: APC family permease [Candidatus Polarisedimenticolia bacterium]|nr:APC family permease [Candidatus Polarisedimenticolia bacterium]